MLDLTPRLVGHGDQDLAVADALELQDAVPAVEIAPDRVMAAQLDAVRMDEVELDPFV